MQVYSVGIADDWSFDTAMGQLGCEVHAFDPTVDLPEQLDANVSFHKWGFRMDSIGEVEKFEGYGDLTGPLYTLSEVVQRLGHTRRPLSILKMDCEGCEWDIINSLSKSPSLAPDVLLLEVHLSKEYGLRTSQHLRAAAALFDYVYQPPAGVSYNRFFWHNNAGLEDHRSMIEPLLAAGVPSDSCCREMGFTRPTNKSRAAHRSRKASSFSRDEGI